MAKRAKAIELQTDGSVITTAKVVNDTPWDGIDDYSAATFNVERQEASVVELMASGRIVVLGITAADRIRDRFAKLQADRVYEKILDASAVVPRPKSAAEAMADNIDEILELMGQGLTKEEAIEKVMG